MVEQRKLNNGLAICGIVFAILGGIIGVVLGLIGLKKYPRHSDGYVMSLIALTNGAWIILLIIFNVLIMICFREINF